METNVCINQKAYLSHENGVSLDIIDIVIMDFISRKWEEAYLNEDLVELNGSYYVNVPTASIVEAFPSFRIKTKSGIKRHLKKIKELGFLNMHPNCTLLGASLYEITESFSDIEEEVCSYKHNNFNK